MNEKRVVHTATEKLIQSSHFEKRFFVMCALSGFMATFGILLNDTVILIAAMVLAPLLNPILAASAGIVLGHGRLILYAAKSFLGGFFAVVSSTALFVKLLLFLGYPIEIQYFMEKFSVENPVLLFTSAAGVSGFSAVYAWLRPTGVSNFVGVAIAVSLIPFISFFGILLGRGDFNALMDSAILFGLNLVAIIWGAILAFLILDFGETKKDIDKDIASANGN
ncbi:MAG: DUF389 domain-containing protein [Candidatus Peregrinibacteria bacterium]|nr:DUF389 domain-containing protein [Candidatus Peregrinibacteria bacterium]